MKRGLTLQEAMDYVGVKRRTWEAQWAPRLTSMQQGTCRIFDVRDLDALFDDFKSAAADGHPTPRAAANDSEAAHAHNAPRNGRPSQEKGRTSWAKKCGVSTPKKTPTPGKLTSGGAALDFASAASEVMKKRNAG